MVVTPFGQMRLGDDQAIRLWLWAHKVEHRRLNMGGLLDGPVDSIWMLRHTQYHTQREPLTNEETRLLRLPGTWRSEVELQNWHLLHNVLHKRLGGG